MNGVLFGSIHSYKDWGLILKTRPVVSSPSTKTVYVDIPASDGVLDLTESLTGDVKYNTRTITFEFNVLNARNRWSDIYSDILDFLHGQDMKVILDEDMSFYYLGRLRVNEWKSDKRTSTIVIEGDFDPYKSERFSSLEDWEWDSFSFETGIIREYKDIRVDGELTFNIRGRRKKILPSFIVASDDGTGLNVQVNDDENIYHIPDGRSKVLNIQLGDGDNVLYFTGHGTVSIDYRGGRL